MSRTINGRPHVTVAEVVESELERKLRQSVGQIQIRKASQRLREFKAKQAEAKAPPVDDESA